MRRFDSSSFRIIRGGLIYALLNEAREDERRELTPKRMSNNEV